MEGQGVHVCVRECAYSYDEPPEAVLMRPACLHLVGERQSMLRSPGLLYLAFFFFKASQCINICLPTC